MTTILVGSSVRKVGGDYRFEGVIVAAFHKMSGQVRYVVEYVRGVLHIFSANNLEVVSLPKEGTWLRCTE